MIRAFAVSGFQAIFKFRKISSIINNNKRSPILLLRAAQAAAAFKVAGVGDLLQNLHPNEDHTRLTSRILNSLESLHISCGVNCLEVTKGRDNFVGICVFHQDGSKVLEDNGRKIKSGYIFTERSDILQTTTTPGGGDNNTMHRKVYNLMFDQIEKQDGVLIVGFAQQNRVLKGTSRTFNDETTNLLPENQRGGKALFSLRTLIFGSIIINKINGERNVSPYSACLAMCLFLIVKRDGDKADLEKFPIGDIDLENEEVFLREFFSKYNVDENILKVAFGQEMKGLGPLSFLTLGADKRAERWARAKWAMKQLMDGFKADMTPEQFSSLMSSLSARYNRDTFIGSIIAWLMKTFYGIR